MKLRDILIGVLLLLCVFLFLDDACTNRKLGIARNGYDAQKITTVEVQLKADKVINDLRDVLARNGQRIEYLEEEIDAKDLVDVERERRIEELESEEVVLVDDGDKDNIIVNLRKQVNVWKERFTLARGVIEDQKEIIFSLRANYDTQVKITSEVVNKLNSEKALRASAENVIKESVKEMTRLRVKAKLKTGGIALIGGILLYTILK